MRFALFPGKIKADGTMSSPTIINLELKWSNGGEARYLNAGEDGSIVFSDPVDGPVATTFFPKIRDRPILYFNWCWILR